MIRIRKPGFAIIVRLLKCIFEDKNIENMQIRLYQPKSMEKCFQDNADVSTLQQTLIDTILLELDKYHKYFTPQLNSTIQSNMKNVMKALIVMIHKHKHIDENKIDNTIHFKNDKGGLHKIASNDNDRLNIII